MLMKTAHITNFIYIFISIGCFLQVSCIYQNCSSGCPTNSVCGNQAMCICNDGWILNCSTPATNLGSNPIAATILLTDTYYVIQPQDLFTYIKFSIKFSTTDTQSNSYIITFWGQTGFLKDLTDNNKMQALQISLNSSETQSIETTYFEFGLQPNGQPQAIYVGIKLNSTTITSAQISISADQSAGYNQSVFRIVLTVLMGILSVACFVLLGLCIYRRRRMEQMRQRAEQQKQIKPTQHFEQYMPKVTADRVNMPLQICSVCLNEILLQNEVRLTICKHLFHADCIDSWCKKSNNCPICRQQLDLQSCQKILGQDFDLSERLSNLRSGQKQKTPRQVQMMDNGTNRNDMSRLHQQVVEENSMRRNML